MAVDVAIRDAGGGGCVDAVEIGVIALAVDDPVQRRGAAWGEAEEVVNLVAVLS